MIAVVVVNYRQPQMTVECLESLYIDPGIPFRLYVIDNAPDQGPPSALEQFVSAQPDTTWIRNERNLGFAAACNQALSRILNDSSFHAVAFLNNDAVATPGWLHKMESHLDPEAQVAMVAARMLDYENPDQIDSLGIVLYRSGIASNRSTLSEPLLGPCAGAALYSVPLLHAVQGLSGYVFDPDFFCYAEDTDLAMRARALGFGCAFADDAVVLHRRTASSGGGYNEFVAYHGLRNSLFAMCKNLPGGFFLRNFGWILLMQLAVGLKYLAKGKPLLLWRIYRDFLRGWPRVRSQRREQCARLPHPWHDWADHVSSHFYDRGYIRDVIRTLHHRDIRKSGV